MGLYELAVDFVTISDSKNKGSIKLYLITRDIFDYKRKKSWGVIVSNLLNFYSLLNLVPGIYQAPCVITPYCSTTGDFCSHKIASFKKVRLTIISCSNYLTVCKVWFGQFYLS